MKKQSIHHKLPNAKFKYCPGMKEPTVPVYTFILSKNENNNISKTTSDCVIGSNSASKPVLVSFNTLQ